MTDNLENPVETSVLEELKEVLADDFSQLVNTYLDDANARMERLRTAAESAEMQTVKSEAHALKGSSKNLGAFPLGDLYAEMENMGNQESSEHIPALMARIESELVRVESFLRGQI